MTGVEGAFMGQEAAGSHRPRIVFHLPGASSETVGEARNMGNSRNTTVAVLHVHTFLNLQGCPRRVYFI